MKTKSFSSGDVRIRDGMSLIEGGLPIPDGMPDISCVLAITGTAQTDEVICTEGMVTIKGKAFFQVLYVDSENQPHSFDAECAFTQNVEGDFSEGMITCAAVRIGEISFKESPRRIDIRTELLSDVFAGKNEVCEIIEESEGVEVLKNTQRISNLNDLKHAQAFTKGTIVIPQSMPEVKEVLMACANVSITAVHQDIERLAVEGEIKLNIIYVGTDKNAPLQYMNETVPFSEIIPVEGEGEAVVICAPAKIYVEKSLEEADTLNYSCIIDLIILSRSYDDIPVIEDAYSTECESTISRCNIPCCDVTEIPQQKRIIRAGAAIPEMLPEAARVLICLVTPEITSAQASRGSIMIEGVLHTMVCYTTASLGMRSAKIQVPFETEINASIPDNAALHICASCEYAAAEGSGREIELRVCLIFSGTANVCNGFSAITDLVLGEPYDSEGGIILYFADDGESDWDIMQKFKVRKDRVLDMDDDRKMIIK